MATKTTRKQAKPISTVVVPDHDPLDPDQNPDDPTVPWSKAWVARHMAQTDARYVRVANDEDCCAGQLCMHYKTTARRKVRGKGAAAPTGVAVSLEDATLQVRGLLKALGRYN